MKKKKLGRPVRFSDDASASQPFSDFTLSGSIDVTHSVFLRIQKQILEAVYWDCELIEPPLDSLQSLFVYTENVRTNSIGGMNQLTIPKYSFQKTENNAGETSKVL